MPDAWWKTAVVYQIYPRSFQDSNGDGIGDLEGIRSRLDYLVWLGVDAIWISPFYPSPMHDFGYDVADYCDVDPIFGSLAAFDRLAADAHGRGIKIILDLVPNHTSSSHAWFMESRGSRDNPRRGWYIWRDPGPNGGPPNNWISNFGGPAWTFDDATGQYYYHAYLPTQPDLNWRNPQVREAMHEVMRFWLKRGVDGFRVDVIWHLMKDELLRDNPPNPAWTPKDPAIERLLPVYSADQPEVHDVIAGLRRVLDEFDARVLIGEIYLPLERLAAYYGKDLAGAHLPFNFQLLEVRWSAKAIARLAETYEASIPEGGWPNWVLSNHDRPRIAARVGAAQARIAIMLLLTLRGTPTLYYGDEIGLSEVEVPPERIRDPWALREPDIGVGRDPARSPMQWDAGAFAGFSTHEPWLPLTDDWLTRNVETMRVAPGSVLRLFRTLLWFRRSRSSLRSGDWRLLSAEDDILAYERADSRERTIVALNFAAAPRQWRHPDDLRDGLIALSTQGDRGSDPIGPILNLRADEGVVIAAARKTAPL
ncbi:alpha-amylase family glycosyl hydrolase [Methylocapsa palsarum]|uniref:Alpha-glucosidase n=1 Tax=Methylocapsa palsarum TaxID=1612308 RepID=A0A1I3XF11_9HYPH|nr:alpha-amylase family glycosyl hydrolase [Methylocapsa palsarum]SFK18128.1 alpha-glucosidase [Methylocapsa palsarum]